MKIAVTVIALTNVLEERRVKMAYAIMRFAKIKSVSTFDAIERHARDRTRLKRRSRPQNTAIIINNKYYDKDMSLVERFKHVTKDIPHRKDAVLGLEFVLTYSSDAEGIFDEIEWIKANIKWLKSIFNDSKNIIHFRVDRDEKTNHCHCVVVPIHNKKLSARHYINGKSTLSHLQDTYAEAMKSFGLKRGRRFLDSPELPTARHKSLNEYYREIDEIKTEIFDKERV